MLIKLSNNLKSNFYEFFKFFWPLASSDSLVLSKHIDFICRDAQIIGEYIIKNEVPQHKWNIYNVPPGSTKSTILSILFPTWLIANNAGLFVINTSYSATLATRFVRKSLEIIQSQSFQTLFPTKLIKTTESYFETDKGGGRFATSIGGTITGMHANVNIIDDPINVEQSYSEAERAKANRYITETLPDRVRNKEKAPIIMIMQRVHEDDPTGHVLNKKLSTHHICLPSELSEHTTKGLEYIYTNGFLCPVRINEGICKDKRAELGTFGYSGQYLQNPVPKGGGKIKRSWFNEIHEKELPADLVWDLWIDGAYTKSTSNDPTGMILTAFKDKILYIKHGSHAWLEMPQLLKKVPEYCKLNGFVQNSMIYIEPKASGHSLKQMLINATLHNVKLIESKLVGEGKEARIQTASPKVESGRVTVVKGQWLDEFYSQLEGFPNVKHDEYVDLIGYACDKYFNVRDWYFL
jgi:predicted phage terminase large subunit-like protein